MRRASRSIPRHAEDVQEFLYRFGCLTRYQVASWLRHRFPELAARDVSSRARRSMTRPQLRSKSVPLPPSYRVAGTVLAAMEKSDEVERIGLRRTWLGKKESGRLESAYRLSRLRGGEAIIEAGLVAGVDGEGARSGYGRIWYGGAVSHSSQRADLLEIFVSAGESLDHNECGILADADSAWGESSDALNLIGARLEGRDAAGRPSRSGRGRVSPSRLYARVIPDATVTLTMFPLPTLSPYDDEMPDEPEKAVAEEPDGLPSGDEVEYYA